VALDWPYAQERQQQFCKASLELSATAKEGSWTAKDNFKWSMPQELEKVGYSWERAKVLAKTRVHLRVLVDTLCTHGGDKG